MLSFNHVNHDIVEADNVVNKGRKLLNRMNFTQQYWITEKLERVFPVFNISTNSLFFYQPNRLLQFKTVIIIHVKLKTYKHSQYTNYKGQKGYGCHNDFKTSMISDLYDKAIVTKFGNVLRHI